MEIFRNFVTLSNLYFTFIYKTFTIFCISKKYPEVLFKYYTLFYLLDSSTHYVLQKILSQQYLRKVLPLEVFDLHNVGNSATTTVTSLCKCFALLKLNFILFSDNFVLVNFQNVIFFLLKKKLL